MRMRQLPLEARDRPISAIRRGRLENDAMQNVVWLKTSIRVRTLSQRNVMVIVSAQNADFRTQIGEEKFIEQGYKMNGAIVIVGKV